MSFLRSIALFIVAGLAEIGGGWLVWQGIRERRGLLMTIMGAVLFFGYGLIPTLQQESAFGRVYAAYGGIFIVLSLVWARIVDRWQPDRFDVIGAGVALVGVAIIMWGRKIF